jgi:hypothetical protein
MSTATDYRPMSEREIGRFVFRVGLLQRRGLTEAQAETLAERLLARDRDGDDRRICLECSHLQRDGGCALHREGRLPEVVSRIYTPVRDVLQRCAGFSWSTPA